MEPRLEEANPVLEALRRENAALRLALRVILELTAVGRPTAAEEAIRQEAQKALRGK